jgi:hypothetical protein
MKPPAGFAVYRLKASPFRTAVNELVHTIEVDFPAACRCQPVSLVRR